MKTSFMPRSASTTPSRTAAPSGPRSLMTTSVSRPPSTSSTPYTIATRAIDLSKASVLHGAGALNPSSSTVPTKRTSDIKCHCYHVLATSGMTVLARNHTLLQLIEVMYVLVILKMI
jgi:hypothetical protein